MIAVFILFGGRAFLPSRGVLAAPREDDDPSVARAVARLQWVLLGMLPSYFGVVFLFSAVLFEQPATSSTRWLMQAVMLAGCVGLPSSVVLLALTRELRSGIPLWLLVLGAMYCQFMLLVAVAAAWWLRALSGGR